MHNKLLLLVEMKKKCLTLVKRYEHLTEKHILWWISTVNLGFQAGLKDSRKSLTNLWKTVLWLTSVCLRSKAAWILFTWNCQRSWNSGLDDMIISWVCFPGTSTCLLVRIRTISLVLSNNIELKSCYTTDLNWNFTFWTSLSVL